MALADRLKELFGEERGAIAEAAKRSGLGYATLYNLYHGKQDNPSRETLDKIADEYRVSVSWLLGADEAGGPEARSAAPEEEGLAELDGQALEMPEVWHRIDAISAIGTISEAARMIRVEQILAAGRMALQHKEARLADGRRRAIERETDAAEARTQAVEREGERADRRLSLYEGDVDGGPPTPPDEDTGGRVQRAGGSHPKLPRTGAEQPPHAAGE